MYFLPTARCVDLKNKMDQPAYAEGCCAFQNNINFMKCFFYLLQMYVFTLEQICVPQRMAVAVRCRNGSATQMVGSMQNIQRRHKFYHSYNCFTCYFHLYHEHSLVRLYLSPFSALMVLNLILCMFSCTQNV